MTRPFEQRGRWFGGGYRPTNPEGISSGGAEDIPLATEIFRLSGASSYQGASGEGEPAGSLIRTINIPVTGLWIVIAGMRWAGIAATAKYRQMQLYKDGAAYSQLVTCPQVETTNDSIMCAMVIERFTKGTELSVRAGQNSGSAINLVNAEDCGLYAFLLGHYQA